MGEASGGVQEVVADKGYHSNAVLVEMAELEVRSYIAEPDRGPRNWTASRWRSKRFTAIAAHQGRPGKQMQRQRANGSSGTFHVHSILCFICQSRAPVFQLRDLGVTHQPALPVFIGRLLLTLRSMRAMTPRLWFRSFCFGKPLKYSM